jgi:hypothetical protein
MNGFRMPQNSIFPFVRRKTSIRMVAKRHGIPWESLRDRIRGTIPRKGATEKLQKLTLFEESVIESYCNTLYGWGWPARIQQIRRMAVELLKDKGDTRDLGKNWHLSFLQRHPDLKSMISSPRSVDRIVAQDRGTFIRWFNLFLEQKEKYHVHEDDVYNMDEKGVALGVAGKQRVIIPKTEKNPHTSGGSGSREWVTATETCSLTGRMLPSWTIFKGVKNLNKWHDTMERIGLADSGYHISTSENGWTDNELGQAFLEDHFDRHTKESLKSEYRILIVDGHDSHLTTKEIQYCLDSNIILLCLPPHATHMLQPLDVGCFGPLAQAYKGMITDAYTFGATYNIDKCQFLEIWHAAREKALTSKNITSSWQKCGILQEELGKGPIDREAVLSQLPPEAEGPQSRPSTPRGPVDPNHLNKTPGNVAEVQAMFQRAKDGDLSDTDTLILLEKLGKAATNAMAEKTVTRAVNQDLVDATKKREKRKHQNREDGADGSYARVMGREELLRRREFGIEKRFEAAWKDFSHAGFAMVFSCNITAKDKGTKPRSSAKSPAKPPTRPVTKSAKRPQLSLPPFSDLTLPSLPNTPNSRDPIRKSPKKIIRKAVKTRVLKNLPKVKEPTSKAPRKEVLKVARKVAQIQQNQAKNETEVEAPITTRSGRTVKSTLRDVWLPIR